MKPLRLVGLSIIVLSLVSSLVSAQTPTYDAVRDWSSQSNPNGVWSYGYLSSLGAPFTLYTAKGTCNVPGASAWWITFCTDPLVAHNDTNKTLCGPTYCVPPHYLAFHPGPNGELSVVRWTAPVSGKYLIQAKFQGQDFSFPTSTYVYVVRNSKRVFLKAPITSYQLPLFFCPPALKLAAGDTLDFMVDWGRDASYIGDSTGVEVRIWTVAP